MLWYLWEPNKDSKDFKITHEKLLELAKNEDLEQIEEDWNLIIKKIRDGKTHEISEADTMYLGACSKGANANSVRQQPFSDIPAMQRAFCFKNSYMTQLVRKYIGDYSDVEKCSRCGTALSGKALEEANKRINEMKYKEPKEYALRFSKESDGDFYVPDANDTGDILVAITLND